jgi:RNA polymerase sigma-70 factor (ECF subfamily)
LRFGLRHRGLCYRPTRIHKAGAKGEVVLSAQTTDGELVVQAREGSQDAFAMLVQRHRRMIWSVCLRITADRHDAEDAVQDALVAAWHHLGSFRGEAALSTWLYRNAANAATAIVRRRRPEPMEELPLPDVADFSGALADVDLVQTALAQLPLAFRQALVLRELCDLTYEQIAAQQGVGIQTVKSRLHRGRSMLKAVLERADA